MKSPRDPEPDAEGEDEVDADDREVEGMQGCILRRAQKKGPPAEARWARSLRQMCQAVKLLPHPHPPVAFGLLKVNPDSCIEVT